MRDHYTGKLRIENSTCQEGEICLQSDLSGKALYLRPCEYWSYLIHTIKSMGISKRACVDYTMLYNKPLLNLLITIVPPAKTAQNLP
jgi:hypothetical protein